MALKRAFIFSIEALLAAILLFGIFLFVSGISRLPDDYSNANPILFTYAEGMASAMEGSGAFEQFFVLGNDSLIRNISDSMPPSVCSQIEMYRPDPIPEDLYYSYTTASCQRLWSTPVSQYIFTHENRTSRTDIKIYWIRVIAYAKE